jgi:ferredoxin
MSIIKVWVEEECNSCGLCKSICPEVFKMKDKASVIKGVHFSDYESQIKDAAEICPVEVIPFLFVKKGLCRLASFGDDFTVTNFATV